MLQAIEAAWFSSAMQRPKLGSNLGLHNGYTTCVLSADILECRTKNKTGHDTNRSSISRFFTFDVGIYHLLSSKLLERCSLFCRSLSPKIRNRRSKDQPVITVHTHPDSLPCKTVRSQTSERVYVLYPDDEYGPVAASAFARAVRRTTDINVDYNAARQSPSTIHIAAS